MEGDKEKSPESSQKSTGNSNPHSQFNFLESSSDTDSEDNLVISQISQSIKDNFSDSSQNHKTQSQNDDSSRSQEKEEICLITEYGGKTYVDPLFTIDVPKDEQNGTKNTSKENSLDKIYSNPRESPNPSPNDSVDKEPPINPEFQRTLKAREQGAKLLAERLRKNASIQKPFQRLSLSIDLSEDSSQSGLQVIIPQKKKRQILKEQMLDAHSRSIKDDINEEPGQEIQDEEYNIEEEEEEDKIDNLPSNNEIIKKVIEELKKDDDENDTDTTNTMTEEEKEHQLYERIVEMRLTEDLEEIKKIIRVITGQWRSGKLRFGDIADGLEKAFEGNDQERKVLESKRMMRKQRKQKKNEEKTRKITQESITQLIEKAMWIKAGSEENASASDIIRGEVARLSDNDPRKEIMQKLEMDAFVQEERAKKALDERRISKNHHMKQVEKLQASTEKPISMIPFKSSHISRQKSSFSFNLSKEKDRSSRESSLDQKKKPKKRDSKKKNAEDEMRFAEFLNQVNK